MKNRQMQALLIGPDGLSTNLRAARGRLSMQQLADILAAKAADSQKIGKWSSSKVSKIETGQQLPSAAEVDLWADATGADTATRQRWQQLLTDVESKRSLYQRRSVAVRDSIGGSAGQLESAAATTRVVDLNVIPELLQIEGYTRAVLAPTRPDVEIQAVVDDLRERQKALHAPGKTFEFLIGEGALRSVRGSRALMAAQLDRLATVATLESVTVGVLPLATVLTGPPIVAGFSLYDLDEAVVSDGVEDHRYRGEPAAALLNRLNAAWGDAVKDRAARRLISDIADSLSSD